MLFKKKMFAFFSCPINVTVTSQSNIPFFRDMKRDIKCMKTDCDALQLK